MAQWNLRSRRKSTGSRYKRHGKKKRADRRRDFLPTHIGPKKSLPIRTRGGSFKRALLKTDMANVASAGQYKKVKILSVLENSADPHFVRRNVITKGAIINTEIGKAKVLSRPGQAGNVNAVLLVESKAEQAKASDK